MGRLLAVVCVVLALVLPGASPAATRPLQTGIVANSALTGPERELALKRVHDGGMTLLRISLDWASVAPTRPANAADPADRAYDWRSTDAEVRRALAHGLVPVLSIENAPLWAQQLSPPVSFIPADPTLAGPVRPEPKALGAFARAAATRYDGAFEGLPRVRYWRAWNEPNLSDYLRPQYDGASPVSPAHYRGMLNAFAAAVHGVRAANIVIAGGLSPFGSRTKYVEVVPPLQFMRQMLCMSGGAHPRPTCGETSDFDVWGVHPYTSGGPTHKAAEKDGTSLGDLPAVRRLLDAARASGHVKTHGAVGLWVTEFSWDTSPPDLGQHVVPIKLHARWVAEALHTMWSSGVTAAIWLQLRDAPFPTDPYQSGLYFRGGDDLTHDAPKPAFSAWRFPFTAYRDGKRYAIWGRTPNSRAALVTVQRSTARGWERVGTLRADRYGIFNGRLAAPPLRKLPAVAPSPSDATRYRQAVLRDSPSSYWPLDDAAGNRTRDLAGTRSGALEGGAKRIPGVLGGADGAVQLNGKTGRVSLGSVPEPATVELWLRSNATTEVAAFSDRDTQSRGTFLGVWGAVRARAFDGGGLSGRAWITDGRWHHLVYTYDGAVGRLYVDGRLEDSAAFVRAPAPSPAFLGYDPTLRRYLRGSVDEVALYPYPLTAAQVRTHFLATGRPARYADEFALMTSGQTYLRARLAGGRVSLPFSLTRPPDRFVLPFGL